jgi:hypothetical protein
MGIFTGRTLSWVAMAAVLSLGAVACANDSADDNAAEPTAEATSTSTDNDAPSQQSEQGTTSSTVSDDPVDSLRYNQIQVLGSHNSYHLQPSPEILQTLGVLSKELADSIEYSHPPLDEQLETYGIRQFELDVFADPQGGLYANRQALAVLGKEPASGIAELDEPGFKTFHVQDIDFDSSCLSLVDCLTTINEWSQANPDHVPIMVMIEVKDQSIEEMIEEEGVDIGSIELDFAQPVPTDGAVLDALDAEIRSVIPEESLFTPDDLRGDAADLNSVVTESGWPTLAEMNGQIVVGLVNTGEVRDMYREPSAVLEGRAMFTSADPGDPDAAFVRVDDVLEDRAAVDKAVADGYIVRTRADIPTVEARTGDMTRANAAFESGATFISTDYYVESPFDAEYQINLPDGDVARCNPVTAPPSCPTGNLEQLP